MICHCTLGNTEACKRCEHNEMEKLKENGELFHIDPNKTAKRKCDKIERSKWSR